MMMMIMKMTMAILEWFMLEFVFFKEAKFPKILRPFFENCKLILNDYNLKKALKIIRFGIEETRSPLFRN